MFNVPTCVWNPMDRESTQKQIQRFCPVPKLSARAAFLNQSQGRDVADMVDSLRMNLRQAKHALKVRDQETRKLRSAVTHLESTVALRERELRDTVLCLLGESPAKPHQEWLQVGTSSSRLRLQVHRLQRIVAAKQDHIEHLNRQASLGFLREAREQADEYRTEAKRLSRALAAATGLGGCGWPPSPSFSTGRPPPPATDIAGHAVPHAGGQGGGYRTRGESASSATDAEGKLPRETEPPPRKVPSPARSCDGAPDLREPPHLSSYYLASGKDSRKVRPPEPSLAWEEAPGAATQAPSGERRAARQRDEPRELQYAPRPINGWDALVAGLVPIPPPGGVANAVHGGVRFGRRPISPIRGTGRLSARTGCHQRSPRGSCSPDRSRALGDNKRLGWMVASARLRSDIRQSADEMREALALRDESRRLRTARAERARRARMAQQKIARYREERIRELESRLARQSGGRPPGAHPTPLAESSVAPGNAQVTEQGVSVDTRTANKLQQLSRQRREIEAAIAAALEENPNLEDKSPRSDRLRGDGAESLAVGNDRPKSGRRKRTQVREEDPHRRQQQQQQQQPPRRRRSGDSSSRTQEDSYVLGQDYDYQEQHGSPAVPLGKPPLAPSRAGGERRRQHSDARRRPSVSEVDERLDGSEGGGIPESYQRDGGNGRDSDVDEVQTEDGNGNDSVWSNNRLSDVGGSVWEESAPSRGWDGDDGRGEVPPLALMKTEEIRARGDVNRPRRQRHWVRSGGHEHVEPSTANKTRDEERDIGRNRGGSLEQRPGPRTDHGEVVGHLGASEPLDDHGSYNSRWSLSDEDETPERSGGESGASTRQAYAGDAGGSDDRAREQSGSSHRDSQEHGWDEDEVASNRKEGGGNVAGMVPEYLDDFFESPEGQDRGDDVPYAVSEPSDGENSAFAAGEELPSAGKPVSTQSLIVDQDESQPAGVDDDTDQVLLQPVSPPVLRHSTQAAAIATAKTEGISLERAVEVQISPAGKPAAAELDGGPSKDDLALSHSTENEAATTVDDARDNGRTSAEEGESEGGDVAAPMRIDSAVLFASLSSSTAGASLSSKSMARAEGKWGSRTGTAAAALGARQGEASASTFALSTTDDDGDSGANPEKQGDVSRGRSSASLSGSQTTRPPDDDTSDKRVGGGRVAADAYKGSEPRASAPPLATSTRSESGSVVTFSPEVDRRSGSPAALSERQSSPPISDEPNGGVPRSNNSSGSAPAPSPLPSTTPSESEATKPVVGERPVPLLGKEEGQPSPEGPHHATLEPEQEENILSTPQSSSSPRGEQAPADSSEISSTVGGDPTVQVAVLDSSSNAPSQRTQTEGVAGDLDNEPSINEPEGDKASYLDGQASPDEHERGFVRNDHEGDESARDQEGGRLGTLEGRSLLAENSSHSGNALDVGGGGVDGDDDDDGYF
ncbi:unnamed protein product [Ectocarpus fasciculatus]